jgi:hypothetical protein
MITGQKYEKRDQRKQRMMTKEKDKSKKGPLTCNALLSRQTQENRGSRPVQAKLVRPYLKNKLGVVVHICGSSYSGGQGSDDQGLKPARIKS